MTKYASIEDVEVAEDAVPVIEKTGSSKVARIGVSIVVALAMVAGVRKLSSPVAAKKASFLDSSDPQSEWMKRSDVQQYAAEKVVYGSLSEDDIMSLFKKFQSDYHTYDSVEKENDRFAIFKKNLRTIDALNRQNPIALFGITEAADQTEEERSNRKMSAKWSNYANMKASLPTEMVKAAAKGPEHVMGKVFSADADDDGDNKMTDDGSGMSLGEFHWATQDDCAACTLYPNLTNYNLTHAPENFDWRQLGAVTSVKNQKYCGSCWTFSTAQDVEGTHYFATGNLTSFSEQQLVACDTKNYGCDGGWMYAAMQYLSNFGIMLSAEALPYEGIFMDYEKPTPTCDTDLLNSKLKGDGDNVAHVSGYQMVAMGEDFEELMKVYLVKNGPLSLAINANGMEYYIHGITGCETISGSEYCEAGSIDDHTPCDPEELDHGVLAVGFGIQEGTEYWVIKNSWAEEWGEDGYYRIERGTDHCGVANMVQHTVVKMA